MKWPGSSFGAAQIENPIMYRVTKVHQCLSYLQIPEIHVSGPGILHMHGFLLGIFLFIRVFFLL